MKRFLYSDHGVTVSPISIVFSVFFLLSLYFIYYVRSILILLLLAFIIMVALHPLVNVFHLKLKLPKIPSIFLSYIVLLLVIILLLALIIPPLAREVFQLLAFFDLPVFQDEIKKFSFTLQEFSSVLNNVSGSFNVVFSVINTTFSSVLTMFTLMVLSFYLMLERQTIHRKLYWFTDKVEHVEKAEKLINSIETQLGGWVRAQVILMFSIFIITYVSLSLMSIPYTLPLALLAGALEIVPNLGPTIAMMPAVFVAYMTFGPVMAGIVFLLYLIIQQLENNVLVPRVMKTSANVNPLIAIIVILTGLKLGGVVGSVLSVPLYIIVRSLYSTFIKPKLMELD